jgi:hypothetical protein
VQSRRLSQLCRWGRVAGCGIIGGGEAIVPIFIDRGAPHYLRLIGAVDLERDGMGVLEPRAAVEPHEALAGKREVDDQHGAGLSGRACP